MHSVFRFLFILSDLLSPSVTVMQDLSLLGSLDSFGHATCNVFVFFVVLSIYY